MRRFGGVFSRCWGSREAEKRAPGASYGLFFGRIGAGIRAGLEDETLPRDRLGSGTVRIGRVSERPVGVQYLDVDGIGFSISGQELLPVLVDRFRNGNAAFASGLIDALLVSNCLDVKPLLGAHPFSQNARNLGTACRTPDFQPFRCRSAPCSSTALAAGESLSRRQMRVHGWIFPVPNILRSRRPTRARQAPISWGVVKMEPLNSKEAPWISTL